MYSLSFQVHALVTVDIARARHSCASIVTHVHAKAGSQSGTCMQRLTVACATQAHVAAAHWMFAGTPRQMLLQQ